MDMADLYAIAGHVDSAIILNRHVAISLLSRHSALLSTDPMLSSLHLKCREFVMHPSRSVERHASRWAAYDREFGSLPSFANDNREYAWIGGTGKQVELGHT